jgi:hypothetical protein
MHVDL